MGLREGGCFSPCPLSFSISRQVSPPHPYYTHNTQPQTCRPSYGPTYSPPRPLWRTGKFCHRPKLPLPSRSIIMPPTATPFTAHSHPSPPHHSDSLHSTLTPLSTAPPRHTTGTGPSTCRTAPSRPCRGTAAFWKSSTPSGWRMP